MQNDLLRRFNIASCAMARAKEALKDFDYRRFDRELHSFCQAMEHGTTTTINSAILARQARHEGYMEGLDRGFEITRRR